MHNGWNQDRKSFVMSYGSDTLDAANLIMPLVFFMASNGTSFPSAHLSDPKMIATLQAIAPDPTGIKSGGLSRNGTLHIFILNSSGMILRYDNDKVQDALLGQEGAFNMCNLWFIEALTRESTRKWSVYRDFRYA